MQGLQHRMLLSESLQKRVWIGNLGREKFIERVWKWKEQSGGIIIEQLKRLDVHVTGLVNVLP